MIRVALIDDHAMVRAGFRMLLEKEPGIEVVGEAEDGEQGLALLRRLRPDVALLDLHGRLLRTTDAALWQAAAPHVALRGAQYAELELNARSYTVSSMPVNDLAGHAAGTLVTLADHTQDAEASRFLERLALGA